MMQLLTKTFIAYLLIAFLLIAFSTSISAQNPYESLGIQNTEVLTLTNGKYNEFFTNDSIVRIGTVLLNTKSKKVISFVVSDSVEHPSGFEPQLVSRWVAPDPLSEKYIEWSPYNYVLNNPIIYIDPDGREVVVNNMRKEQNEAFHMLMQTESGRAYVAQFLKEGESIQGYDYTATATGKYSNSKLTFGAYNMSNTVNGISQANHSDGSKLLSTKKDGKDYESGGDLGKLQKNQSFEMVVGLNANKERTAAEWAETLGHEVFVHSIDDAAIITNVIEALQNGASMEDLEKLGLILEDAAKSATDDHNRLNSGKDNDYNNYMNELNENDKKDEE